MSRVLIADDHPLFRMGLAYALKAQGFEVVAEVADGRAALEACRAFRPDIALLDVKMPVLDGLEACKHIKNDPSPILVVMLTTFDEPAILAAAKAAGATAYLSKDTDPTELAGLLREVVAAPERDWLPVPHLPTLTTREAETLQLLAAGHSNKSIAKRLGVSPETVKDHLSSVYRKLEVNDRLSAVGKARDLGLLR